MHCAASVDFMARLDISIDINIKGTLKIFDLCKKMKHLDNFIHVSTCYVNAHLSGEIKDKIYQKTHFE
jgi:hypothetical protein